MMREVRPALLCPALLCLGGIPRRRCARCARRAPLARATLTPAYPPPSPPSPHHQAHAEELRQLRQEARSQLAATKAADAQGRGAAASWAAGWAPRPHCCYRRPASRPG